MSLNLGKFPYFSACGVCCQKGKNVFQTHAYVPSGQSLSWTSDAAGVFQYIETECIF